MADYALPVRRAVLPALKANAGVTALIPAASLYPSTVPTSRTFPFGRYGQPILTPFRASGLNSSAMRFAYHAFTKPLYNSSNQMLATAEDQCGKMAAAIKDALDGRTLPIEGGMRVTLTWLGSNCLMDGDEADAWHAVVNFLAEVAG